MPTIIALFLEVIVEENLALSIIVLSFRLWAAFKAIHELMSVLEELLFKIYIFMCMFGSHFQWMEICKLVFFFFT